MKISLLKIGLFFIIFIGLFFSISNANQIADTSMYIDTPMSNKNIQEDILTIDGWVMSKQKNTYVKIYIDGIEIEDTVERYKRPDVIDKITNFGTSMQNPLPGFKVNVDISNMRDGKNHKITVRVFSLYNEVILEQSRTVVFDKYKAKAYIDSPANETIKTSMYIRGWKMSDDKKATVKISIDNVEQKGLQIQLENRPDVIKAISGYGGQQLNLQPGFITTIDTSNLLDGHHELKVEIISRNGEILTTETRSININKYPTKMYIDNPTKETIKQTMTIRGWKMSEDKDSTIKISIDNIEQKGLQIQKENRTDVLKAISGYGGQQLNPQPGFTTTVDTSNILDGQHELKIEVISKNGEILSKDVRIITIKKYDAKMYIDSPKITDITKTNLYIRGWKMSDDKEATMKVSVNNVEQKNLQITKENRQDVLESIPGYGGQQLNPQPGFIINIDTSNMLDGTYELKIEIISREGNIIAKDVRNITVKKYDAKIYLDKPVIDQVIRGETIIIKGWEMSEQLNSTLKIYIDNTLVSGVQRQERQDVLNAIKDYGGRETNKTPGFYVEANIAKLSEGIHTLKVEVWSEANEKMNVITKTFRINREYLLGIDVSQHNGVIDWQKVKDDGINFAIIRCGYGQNIESQDDKRFQYNISECERLGIPYGVYIYSYAANREGARSEAEHVIRLLNGRNPSFGVWIDMEDADGYKIKNNIPYSMGSEICDEFCSHMKDRGYKAGIYANLDWLTNYLTASYLDQYPKWVAQWNSTCTYEGKYVMWQFTDSGKVEGITGNVDMNKWYKY